MWAREQIQTEQTLLLIDNDRACGGFFFWFFLTQQIPIVYLPCTYLDVFIKALAAFCALVPFIHKHTPQYKILKMRGRKKIKMKENKSENVYTICVCVCACARAMYKTQAQILNFMNRMRKNEEAMENIRDATQKALYRTRTHTQSTLYDGLFGGYNHTQPFHHCRYVDVLLVAAPHYLNSILWVQILGFWKIHFEDELSCEFRSFIVLFLRNNCWCLFHFILFYFSTPPPQTYFLHNVQLLSAINSFRIAKKK